MIQDKKHFVGTSWGSIVDTRSDELSRNGDNRKIEFRLYYPVNKNDCSGKEKCEILTPRKLNAVLKALYIKKNSRFDNQSDYYDNPEMEEGSFPLIVFNGAYNGFIEQNTRLCTQLASKGYIIVSVGHAHEFIINEYEDGSIDKVNKKLSRKATKPFIPAMLALNKLLKSDLSKERAWIEFDKFQHKFCSFLMQRVKEWASDTTAVINMLKSNNQNIDSKWYNKIDFSNGIAAAGHSLGGATAYYLCMNNDDFCCGVNMDGALLGEYDKKTMNKPFLQMSCDYNRNVQTRALIKKNAPAYSLVFHNTKHVDFSDLKYILPRSSRSGTIDSDVLHNEILNSYLSFFDKYLRKNTDRYEPISQTSNYMDYTEYL